MSQWAVAPPLQLNAGRMAASGPGCVKTKSDLVVTSSGAQPGSISAAEFSARHGRTCFNIGRQGTQPLCRRLIDEIGLATKGKHRARSTSCNVLPGHGDEPHLQEPPDGLLFGPDHQAPRNAEPHAGRADRPLMNPLIFQITP
jgi:hypothetical protein